MKFRNKNKFRYGVPAYTGPFRALPHSENHVTAHRQRNTNLGSEVIILFFRWFHNAFPFEVLPFRRMPQSTPKISASPPLIVLRWTVRLRVFSPLHKDVNSCYFSCFPLFYCGNMDSDENGNYWLIMETVRNSDSGVEIPDSTAHSSTCPKSQNRSGRHVGNVAYRPYDILCLILSLK
jgi:hypothetical protein